MPPPPSPGFESLLGEVESLLGRKPGATQELVDLLAARVSHYSWVGIYLVSGNDLLLGPWQGPEATEHVRIPIGQGICGAAAASGVTEIVPDVDDDNRYLACFASTRSEIVVPILHEDVVLGEIDIDSDRPNAFAENDQAFLEHVAALLGPTLGGASKPA
jgi:L-methionine (R)-S-oxide reductase